MIEVTPRGSVAIFKMTHGKANALDLEFCEAIAARLEEIRTSSARAVVVTAPGRIFSAGVDLVRLMDGGPDYTRAFLPVLSKAFEALFFFPKPLIAAINGHAIAGGCVLACTADKRIMARGSGRVGVPELLVGVPFPFIALETMRFGTAPQHFQEVMYGGSTFLPEDAMSRGLLDEIVEPQELMNRALAAAESLAALVPDAFGLTKRLIRQPVLKRFREDASVVHPAIEDAWTSPEALATMRDYVSKTLKKH